ncbi:MAG: PHP domain-containing protein [Planctomycetes bacterium]|nr:PHP domain-containing protein [Planctomycetota bacterium]
MSTSTVRLLSPYSIQAGQSWLRGNLHTHSEYSDGLLSVRKLKELYKGAGYHFLAITDHDSIGAWHGQPFVLDLTEPPNDIHEPPKFVAFPGYESDRQGISVNCIGARPGLDGVHKPLDDLQGCITQVNAEGGFALLNHPHFMGLHDAGSVLALDGLLGVEIANTKCVFATGMIAAGLATDLWDAVLSQGARLWGFATDDYHADDISPAFTGWVMARATAATPEAILASLKAGNFYASTGITIRDISVAGATISIKTENAYGIRFVGKNGRVLREANGPNAAYTATGSEDYVRIECWNGSPVFSDNPRLRFFAQMAWSQPIFVARE